MSSISIILLVCLLVCLIYAIQTRKQLKEQKEVNTKMLSQKKSSEVRLGQISEHLAPFLANFKYNPKKAHFLGMPIDYIVFEDDKIIFLEVKSGQSKLSPTQRSIKKLVDNKEVVWEVMQIN